MRNSRILSFIKCFTFVAVLFLVAIPSYVLRSRHHLKEHIRKHQVTSSPEIVSQAERNLSAKSSSNQVESAFRRLGYGDIELMQTMESTRPLFRFTSSPKAVKCREENIGMTQGPRWSMIVGVKSNADQFKRRELIRKTWGSYRFFNGVRLEFFFVVGQATNGQQRSKLLLEEKVEQDILQPDDKEIEKDNGRKALAAMQWVSDYCASHWIYSSADSDMIPNLAALYKQIDNFATRANNQIARTPIMCAFGLRSDRHPTRNSENLDYVSKEVYPLENYPPHCAGFYSMPVWLSSAIYKISRYHKYFNVDDVWITGLLRISLFDSSPAPSSDLKCDVADEYCGILERDSHSVEYSPVSDEAYEEEWKKIEKTFPADQMESAYRRLGISYIELMRKMESPRPLFNFTITPSEAKCSEKSTNNTTEAIWSMIVFVKSHADHFDQRAVIRRTWGSYKFFHGVRLEVVFVIGKSANVNQIAKLEVERKTYEDILQVDRKEIYQDVGYKAIASMQWCSEHCPSHWLYSSADDDMIPNLVSMYDEIKTLIAESQGRIERTPIFCGFSYRKHKHPFRPPSRNDVTVKEYPLDDYPPFCAGGFYSMPVGLSAAIYNFSRNRKYFCNDDVWITGLLRLGLFDSDPVFARNFSCDVTKDFCGLSTRDPESVKHNWSKNIEKEWENVKKKFPKL